MTFNTDEAWENYEFRTRLNDFVAATKKKGLTDEELKMRLKDLLGAAEPFFQKAPRKGPDKLHAELSKIGMEGISKTVKALGEPRDPNTPPQPGTPERQKWEMDRVKRLWDKSPQGFEVNFALDYDIQGLPFDLLEHGLKLHVDDFGLGQLNGSQLMATTGEDVVGATGRDRLKRQWIAKLSPA